MTQHNDDSNQRVPFRTGEVVYYRDPQDPARLLGPFVVLGIPEYEGIALWYKPSDFDREKESGYVVFLSDDRLGISSPLQVEADRLFRQDQLDPLTHRVYRPQMPREHAEPWSEHRRIWPPMSEDEFTVLPNKEPVTRRKIRRAGFYDR